MALLAVDRSAVRIELPRPGGDRILIAAAKTDRFSEEHYRSFYGWLDEDEREWLQRLRFAGNRREYLLAHPLARWVLAACLDGDPTRIRIVREKSGKPRLAETESPAFSLSHTTGGVLCAIGYTSCLGADIELVSRRFSMADVLHVAYTSSERHRLAAMNGGDLDALALRWWTVKEAFIKADGRGVGISPAAICCAQDGAVPMGSLDLSTELLPDRVAGAYRGEVVRGWSGYWMAWIALGDAANLQPCYWEWLGGEHWVRLWPDRRWRFRQALE